MPPRTPFRRPDSTRPVRLGLCFALGAGVGDGVGVDVGLTIATGGGAGRTGTAAGAGLGLGVGVGVLSGGRGLLLGAVRPATTASGVRIAAVRAGAGAGAGRS